MPPPPKEPAAPAIPDSHQGPLVPFKPLAPGTLLRAFQESFAESLPALADRLGEVASVVGDQDSSSSSEDLWDRPLPDPAAPPGPWRQDPPEDAPWEGASGIMKLSRNFLPREGPRAPRWVRAPANHLDSLENLYGYLMASSVDEDLQNRRHELLTQLQDLRDHPPTWFVLEPAEDLRPWKETLESVPQMDIRGIEAFKDVLFSSGSNSGFYEANRILFHLLKDSTTSARSSGRVGPWMHKAASEALDAIANWREWDSELQRSSGKVWSAYKDHRGRVKGFWSERPSWQQSTSSPSAWPSQAERDPWSRWRGQ